MKKEVITRKFLDIKKGTGQVCSYLETYTVTVGNDTTYERFREFPVYWSKRDHAWYAYESSDCSGTPPDVADDLFAIALSVELFFLEDLAFVLKRKTDIYWCEQCQDWLPASRPCKHGKVD